MNTDIDLLNELVGIPSVTDDIAECGRAVAAMRRYLEAHGIFCTVERLGERPFLCAGTVPGKEFDYLLNAHLDVVPASADMFKPRMDGGIVHGRGVSDCKGNAVAAAQVLCDLVGRASVGAVFTTDEEKGGLTTGEAVRLGYRARKLVFVIDGTPYRITIAQKGILDLKLVARGRGVHSSEPWNGDNAIDHLVDGYARLRAAWPQNAPKSDGNLWFDSCSATIVEGGTAHNKVPDEASLLLNIRYTSPGGEDDIEGFVREKSGLEVERMTVCPPFSCDENSPILMRLLAAMRKIWPERGIQFARMLGATDARHFVSSGTSIAILGCDGGDMHTEKEWLRTDSIGEMATMLSGFILEE